jgi:hypothetical protein
VQAAVVGVCGGSYLRRAAAVSAREFSFRSDNHLIIYSGFERLDPSGDSHIDIEFLKDQVGLDEPLPCNDPAPTRHPAPSPASGVSGTRSCRWTS